MTGRSSSTTARSTAVNRTFFTNDRNDLQTYKGIEITATKRMSNRWQMLAGYTFRAVALEGLSVNTNPNNLINVDGPLAGPEHELQRADRRSPASVQADRHVSDAVVRHRPRRQPERPERHRRHPAGSAADGRRHQHGERRAARLPRLDTRTVMDLRLFKVMRFGTRSLEASVDFNNLTNANTVWDVRTLSGTINLRQNGDPNGAINTVPQFLSPAQVYGPRNVRFNVSLTFLHNVLQVLTLGGAEDGKWGVREFPTVLPNPVNFENIRFDLRRTNVKTAEP